MFEGFSSVPGFFGKGFGFGFGFSGGLESGVWVVVPVV